MLVSTAALAVSAPLQALIAVAVRADSPGPVIFRQTRVGLAGRPFTTYKFRTMTSQPWVTSDVVTGSGDPRITRVGRVLRVSKLDELPQLVNVLKGDMSLVGPRPEVPRYVAQWDPALRPLILSVRPGLTDPASIIYRNEADELAAAVDPERHYVEHVLPRKATMYADYVRTVSWRSDLSILIRTAHAVVRG